MTTMNRRPPLSSKQPSPQPSRRDRRASERRPTSGSGSTGSDNRFEAARADRRAAVGTGPRPTGVKPRGSLVNTRTMTLAGIVVGLLVVILVAVNQQSGQTTLKDPGLSYPAALVDGNALGNANAPVVLDVYADYQCPYCAAYSLNIEPVIVTKYVTAGIVRIVHHDFEFIGAQTPNRESRLAAAGAVCALAQNKYWPYDHWVFNNQLGENVGSFTQDRLVAIAAAAGLDTAAFGTCLSDPATLQTVSAATANALNVMNIVSTPSIFLNGVSADWGNKVKTVTDLEAAIDQIAAAKASASPSSASPSASASTTP